MNRSFWAVALMSFLMGCGSDDDKSSMASTDIENENSPQENEIVIGNIEVKTEQETDFFVLRGINSEDTFFFSNSHEFHFDKSGYLVDNLGLGLILLPVNNSGSVTAMNYRSGSPLQLNYDSGFPNATTQVALNLNLPSSSSVGSTGDIDSQLLAGEGCPSSFSYNNSVNSNVYDSSGNEYALSVYFINISSTTNSWETRVTVNCYPMYPLDHQVLDFGSDGHLDVGDSDVDGIITTTDGLFHYHELYVPETDEYVNFSIDFRATTEHSTTSMPSPLALTFVEQDGYITDYINKLEIDTSGNATLLLGNLESVLLGRVAMAKFSSPYNLDLVRDSVWSETDDSGDPLIGMPEFENFGALVPIEYDF